MSMINFSWVPGLMQKSPRSTWISVCIDGENSICNLSRKSVFDVWCPFKFDLKLITRNLLNGLEFFFYHFKMYLSRRPVRTILKVYWIENFSGSWKLTYFYFATTSGARNKLYDKIIPLSYTSKMISSIWDRFYMHCNFCTRPRFAKDAGATFTL